MGVPGARGAESSPDRDVWTPVPGRLPAIVAHRGAMTERPENTIAALRRAAELGAAVVEVDVRISRDGRLFLLHDPTLDRTTNGTDPASTRTMAELKQLDAGGRFDPKYRGERIPLLREALAACRGRLDVLLDLKGQGTTYAEVVAAEVRRSGDVRRTIVGVRCVEQARQFRRLLPEARQLGFLDSPDQIESFADAGVDVIRLWPSWLRDRSLVGRVRRRKLQLQLNAPDSRPQSLLPLLSYAPDFLLLDDVAAARAVLDVLERNRERLTQLAELVESLEAPRVGVWFSRPGALSFLNRDYEMRALPSELEGRARFVFDGGRGNNVSIRFREPAVVFAAFEYNDTGAWSFP
ncbi:MAG TPA: glycerophosphodiester phosphodiesterase family protein, partial [Planctomycetaceae bacterium]|nr:glycerophosphodiester phosphodiesterase family protein [Planctomycetaceae bacterium]